MVVSPARNLLLRPGYEDARRRFVQDLPRVIGAVPVAGYLPHRDDGLTSICPWSGRVWTAGATVSGQQDPLGGGTARRFLSASTQYSDTPNDASMTFGNGTTDVAFSVLALANVTDTAAIRTIVSKFGTGTGEWEFYIQSVDDTLIWLFRDNSAAVFPFRQSNAAITQGSWRLFGGSYDGTGGATAMNGATLYQDGVVIASTANNSATYVAIEDLTAPMEIGSNRAHTTDLFDGSIAAVAVVLRALSAADHAAAASLFRRLFGVPT